MSGIKMLELNKTRDQYLLFFILLLLLNTGVLFDKSLSYFINVLFCYAILILSINQFQWSWKNALSMLKSCAVIIPLITCIYIFFPRWNSQTFGDFALASPAQTQRIGLTLDLDFQDLAALNPNNSPAFTAWIERQSSPLYWRSHTLSKTDGWNWERSSSDTLYFSPAKVNIDKDQSISYSIHLESSSRYYISLDRPIGFTLGTQQLLPDSYSLSLPFPTNISQKSYKAVSTRNISFAAQVGKTDLVQLAVSAAEKSSYPRLPKNNFFELQKALRQFFDNTYSYTLEPGLINSAAEFMKSKKGFCSHYASLAAQIIRSNGLPARLVSGFLGGQWNPIGSFYLVEQNHAHVWVEVFIDDKWYRLDPTLWVAPFRAQEEATYRNQDKFSMTNLIWSIPILMRTKFWLEKTNADFSIWIDTFNLSKQVEIASKWKMNINEFYLAGTFAIIVALALLFTWIQFNRYRSKPNYRWKSWCEFWRKLNKQYPQLQWGLLHDAEFFLVQENTNIAKKWLKKINRMKNQLEIH